MIEDHLNVKTQSGKITVQVENVIGFYNESNGIFYYKIPVVRELRPKEFQFLEKILDGSIKVYRRVDISGGLTDDLIHLNMTENPHGTSSSVPLVGNRKIYLIAEKNGEYAQVYSGSLIDIDINKELRALREFINDDPKSRMKASEIKLNNYRHLVLEIINDYNVRNLEPDIRDKPEELGEVIIFLKKSRHTKSDIKLLFNEETYELKINRYLSLKLPVNQTSSIKTINVPYGAEGLISAKPYGKTYLELTINKMSGNLVFIEREADYAEHYINLFDRINENK